MIDRKDAEEWKGKENGVLFAGTENKELPHTTQIKIDPLHLLSPERAALGQASLATGGLAEDGCAALADDNGLCVREDGGDGEAAGALDVHEEGSWDRHKGLKS